MPQLATSYMCAAMVSSWCPSVLHAVRKELNHLAPEQDDALLVMAGETSVALQAFEGLYVFHPLLRGWCGRYSCRC